MAFKQFVPVTPNFSEAILEFWDQTTVVGQFLWTLNTRDDKSKLEVI